MADSVDAYIAGFPDEVRQILEKIRTIIRQVAPGAVETISYGIPTFKQYGTYPIYFAGFKNHVSIYPISQKCEPFDEEVAPYRSGRATAKFPLDQPFPYPLVSKIVEFMVRENVRKAHETAKRKEQRI